MQITYDALMPSSFRFRSGDFVQLRDATSSDILQMRKLEQESSSAAHWTESLYHSLFDSPTGDRVIRIAENDFGQILGFVIARCLADQWEIENVVVDPSCRRRGVGSCLIGDLVGMARSAGMGSVLLEVRESNQAARRLYEKIGFTLEGRRKDYYRSPPEPAVLYRLALHFCDKIP